MHKARYVMLHYLWVIDGHLAPRSALPSLSSVDVVHCHRSGRARAIEVLAVCEPRAKGTIGSHENFKPSSGDSKFNYAPLEKFGHANALHAPHVVLFEVSRTSQSFLIAIGLSECTAGDTFYDL